MKIAKLLFLVLLLLAIGPRNAHAFGSYASSFSSRYPSSQSLTNVTSGAGNSCQFCHQSSGGGDPYNAYGWALKGQIDGGASITTALQTVESLNSDGDPAGSSNLTEINANTQPGWRTGASNTIYFANGTTQTNQSPPTGILGSMDPLAATPTASATKTSTASTNTPSPVSTNTPTPVRTGTPMPSVTKTPTPVVTNTPMPSVTGTPGHEICRDARFWGRHAGTERPKSENIVQAALDAAGGAIQICGQNINNTVVPGGNSAVQALCVRPKGEASLQLARQLTAASLNCIMTNGQSDCKGTSVQPMFASCNAACPGGDPSIIDQCVAALRCSNRGGTFDPATGSCKTGTCSDNGAPCSNKDLTQCGKPASASCGVPDESCQDRPLENGALGLDFEGSGSAGSAKACAQAKQSRCTLFSPKDANCP